MQKNNRTEWIDTALSYLRFNPDKKAVRQELNDHLDDKIEALTSVGIPEDMAIRRAVEAMGDPAEVGMALKRAHNPFWGYSLFLIRAVLSALIIFIILSFFNFDNYEVWDINEGQIIWKDVSAGDTVYYPDCTDKSDGYTFTVPSVVVQEQEDGSQHIHLTVRSVNYIPWISHAFVNEFYAEDNLGNRYKIVSDWDKLNINSKIRGFLKVNYLTWQYEVTLDGYEGGAEWIELRYDNYGRDICLHIDLTEGEIYE